MEKKPSLLQFTMNYGAILGIVSIIFSVILYITGYMPINFKRIMLIMFISLVIMLVFLILGTRSYRDKVLGGSISFGQAFLVGLLIIVFSTILASFYNLIFNLYIDPDYINKVMDATKDWMYEFMSKMGAPEADIDAAIEKMEAKEFTPMKSFFQSLFSSAIMGTIISLITSAFIKKNQNPVA